VKRKQQEQVKRYAKMFLNVIGMEDAPKAIEELKAVDAVMSQSKEFKVFLESPGFSLDDRQRVLRGVSPLLALSDQTVRFITRLTEERIVFALSHLISVVVALYLEKKKRVMVVVMTPGVVQEIYTQRLTASLKKLTGKDVDIEYVIDPTLLGGMRIKVGSTMYDSSIKGQLRLLKDDLKKG
jgi:F-type H+-transporting ATPase subunit delta